MEARDNVCRCDFALYVGVKNGVGLSRACNPIDPIFRIGKIDV
jgi:hypothetical protein